MKVESLNFFTCQSDISHPVEELKEFSLHQDFLTNAKALRIACDQLKSYEKIYEDSGIPDSVVGYPRSVMSRLQSSRWPTGEDPNANIGFATRV
ncbi:hypothetical protein [Roseovarius rhodophyticola]|nr:hypothetical protein [Roseovarius sp. W115]MDV2931213.1 hypothetical protein [Roseovarius sp. W115]